MSILNSTSTTKTFTLNMEQLKQIIIQDLGYTPKQLSITSTEKCVSSDPMDRYAPVYAFDGLKIVVTD
jgi:hypothetical protein